MLPPTYLLICPSTITYFSIKHYQGTRFAQFLSILAQSISIPHVACEYITLISSNTYNIVRHVSPGGTKKGLCKTHKDHPLIQPNKSYLICLIFCELSIKPNSLEIAATQSSDSNKIWGTLLRSTLDSMHFLVVCN